MANQSLSAAKLILLTVQAAAKADITVLRVLSAQHQQTRRLDVILRILLTYLPESVDSSEYVPFLEDLISGQLVADSQSRIDSSALEEIDDEEASKKVKKLHLLPLAWPSAPPDAPRDPVVLFLIHRAYKVDEETGLITQLPELIAPFLNLSPYLRTWMISILLPLLRLNYEYHPQSGTTQSIKSFEKLDDRTGVSFLLSRTGKNLNIEGDSEKTTGRDFRGLVGPWMYGGSQWKRRKLAVQSGEDAQTVAPLDDVIVATNHNHSRWDEVCQWITRHATISWETCVLTIEQWDGPGDVDLGGYGDGTIWLEEQEQQRLEGMYARTALAAAYLIPEASVEALTGAQRILDKLMSLLDYDAVPTLPAAAAFLSPIPLVSGVDILSSNNATQLRTGLLEDQNIFTSPNVSATTFLHALLISAYLLTRLGVPCTVRRAGELVLLQDERDQTTELRKLMSQVGNRSKGDDKYWIRTRNELLWLRDWGAEKRLEEVVATPGKGIFGKVRCDFLEMEVLKGLLANTRYSLARSIYEISSEQTLSQQQIQDTVVSAAMNAYDNASNANRTRGGVKKAYDILHAFPDTIRGSLAEFRVDHLISVTHSIGQYRLVLKQGEPFTPVVLRVHGDPISIIGKILDQNPRSYTKINELVHMGEEMVLAGLTVRDVEGRTAVRADIETEQISIAKKRVTSMCIDAALAEDDFETAYSYVTTRHWNVASEAQSRTPVLERSGSGIFAQPAPRVLDDWSWRAALQAGKYRFNSSIVKPTHLGNANGNLEIRHLEQRMDCLSQALRIAPPATLQEILNVYRRCEEELDTKTKQEAEQEAAWDEQGDQNIMPGGFGTERPVMPVTTTRSAASHTGEEAPMSLFDLTRASATHAQKTMSAIASIRGSSVNASKASVLSGSSAGRPDDEEAGTDKGISDQAAHNAGVEPSTIRKRDQLRNVAASTLAAGIGWALGAGPIVEKPDQKKEFVE